jgi:hypothetical protein
MKYHYTSQIEPVTEGIKITITWEDQDNVFVCSGSAVVSRAPTAYVPFLASDIKDQHQELFITEEEPTEGGMINEL